MPCHDWSRVNAGIFHHFHQRWIGAISDDLNSGRLPGGYFALAEQRSAGLVPDVLALEELTTNHPGDESGGVAIASSPPKTRFIRQAEMETYAARADRIAIHHPLGRVVAIIEIVSPGNKDTKGALRSFVEKAADFMQEGVHLLVVDLFPPSVRDPQGIHKAIWDEIEEEEFELPPDKPLTLASYEAGLMKTAYIEPVAAGDLLPDMPVFLKPGVHVLVPLETTYETTWAVCPEPMKRLVENR